jgi:hypothetical protein
MADGFRAANSPSPGLLATLSPLPWGEGKVVPITHKAPTPSLGGEGWGEGRVTAGYAA